MQRHILLIVAIGVAVLIGGSLLVPRGEEHVTMLARDGLYDTASRELSALRNSGDRRPHILMQTHLLHERRGDRAGSLQALEAYIAVRTDDIAAREKRAEHLLQAGQLERYLEALSELVAVNPSSDRIHQLLALYRLHGRFDDELALLKVHAEGKYLRHAHFERLGAVLAERGDWAAAQRWLHKADQSAPSHESSGRLLLFDVLLEMGRSADAFQRARIWIPEWRSAYLSAKLILRIAQAGFGEQASALARLCSDAMPRATFDIAGVLTKRGHGTISQHMLAHWAHSQFNPSGDQLRSYVHASIQAGDARGPFLKLGHLVRGGAEPVMQARLAEELAHAYGFAAIAPLRSLLSTSALLSRPLFAAELAVFEGNLHLARWFVTTVNPTELSPEERHAWLMLLRKVETRRAVFERLARLWTDKRLPPEFFRILMDEARQMGQTQFHDAVWASMSK